MSFFSNANSNLSQCLVWHEEGFTAKRLSQMTLWAITVGEAIGA